MSNEDPNHSGWIPLPDTNENYPSVDCGNGGEGPPPLNYSLPPYNGEGCLYNILIKKDPCEYNDVRNENEDVYNQLWELLLEYNKTMVTPLDLLHPSQSSKADPAKHGGFWSPWQT